MKLAPIFLCLFILISALELIKGFKLDFIKETEDLDVAALQAAHIMDSLLTDDLEIKEKIRSLVKRQEEEENEGSGRGGRGRGGGGRGGGGGGRGGGGRGGGGEGRGGRGGGRGGGQSGQQRGGKRGGQSGQQGGGGDQ